MNTLINEYNIDTELNVFLFFSTLNSREDELFKKKKKIIRVVQDGYQEVKPRGLSYTGSRISHRNEVMCAHAASQLKFTT